jgi:hypothetical protein
MEDDILTRLLHAMYVGDTPQLPRVPPTEVETGLGPSVDRTTTLMPANLRQRLADLAANKKLRFLDMPRSTYGQYDRWTGHVEVPPRMVERALINPEAVAKTLAHETQHSLQSIWGPQEPLPLPNQIFTGDSYWDDPMEIEARLRAAEVTDTLPRSNVIRGSGLPKP